MTTSNTQISFSAALGLVLVASSPSFGHNTLKCTNGVDQWNKDDPIVLRMTESQFPAGDAFTSALHEVAEGWSNTAADVSFVCEYHDDGEFINHYGNAIDEVYWTDMGNEDDEDFVGLCLTTVQGPDCVVIETDVVFNDYVCDFTASQDIADVPAGHGGPGSTFSFQAVAYHEFGHVMGLAHTSDAYSCMGQVPHHHINGSLAIAYPGEDAVSGAIYLKGERFAAPHDLALAPFKKTGVAAGDPEAGGDYATHGPITLSVVGNGPGASTHGAEYELVSGVDLTMEVTVENMGLVPLDTTIAYYLSEDSNIVTSDHFLAEHSLEVARDQPSTIDSPVLSLPDNLVDGQAYWLGAIIDPGMAYPEMSEWNNRTNIPIRITEWKPDLEAISISGPSSVQTGGPAYFVTSHFTNVGGPLNSPVSYKVQLIPPSTGPALVAGAITVAEFHGANPGYHVDEVSIPDGLETGEYEWGLLVEAGPGVEEDDGLDASNFVIGDEVSVDLGPPELVAFVVSGPAYGGKAFGVNTGDDIPVEFTVKNLGSAMEYPVLYQVVLSEDESLGPGDWQVASGELAMTGRYEVTGTFPKISTGKYRWGLIVTSAGVHDDPTNNRVAGGEILVVASSTLPDQGEDIEVPEFVSGPAIASLGQLVAVSFNAHVAPGGDHAYRVVLMPDNGSGAATHKSLTVGTGSYTGGYVTVGASTPPAMNPGTYRWTVVIEDTDPASNTSDKVLIGNEVLVGDHAIDVPSKGGGQTIGG